MSNIPLARQRLAIVRAQMAALSAELDSLEHLMHRRRPARRRSPVKSAFVDSQLAVSIRAYALAHPNASLQDIAVHFRTNAGRVSEAMQRDR